MWSQLRSSVESASNNNSNNNPVPVLHPPYSPSIPTAVRFPPFATMPMPQSSSLPLYHPLPPLPPLPHSIDIFSNNSINTAIPGPRLHAAFPGPLHSSLSSSSTFPIQQQQQQQQQQQHRHMPSQRTPRTFYPTPPQQQMPQQIPQQQMPLQHHQMPQQQHHQQILPPQFDLSTFPSRWPFDAQPSTIKHARQFEAQDPNEQPRKRRRCCVVTTTTTTTTTNVRCSTNNPSQSTTTVTTTSTPFNDPAIAINPFGMLGGLHDHLHQAGMTHTATTTSRNARGTTTTTTMENGLRQLNGILRDVFAMSAVPPSMSFTFNMGASQNNNNATAAANDNDEESENDDEEDDDDEDDEEDEIAILGALSAMTAQSNNGPQRPLPKITLPQFLYDKSAPTNETMCVICQDDYNQGDAVSTLSCVHNFHTACLEKWLTCKLECPLCKEEVRAD